MTSTLRDLTDLEILTLHDVGEILFPNMSPGPIRNKKVGRLRNVGLRFWKNGQNKKSPLVTNYGEVKRWQSSKLTEGLMAENAARHVS